MLKRNIAVTFVGMTLEIILGFVATVITARVLGAEGRGVLALALLIPTIVATFARLGQETVNNTFPGKYFDQKTVLLWQSIMFTLMGGGICALVTAAFYLWLPIPKGNFQAVPPEALMPMLLLGGMSIFSLLIRNLVRGMGHLLGAAVLQSLQVVMLLAGVCIVTWGLQPSVTSLVWVWTVVPFASALPGIWLIRREVSWSPTCLSWNLLKQSLRYGIPVCIATFAGFLVYRVDQAMLGYWVTESQLGLYAVAVTLAERIQILPSAISTAFLSHLSMEWKSRQAQSADVFRVTMVISLATVFLAAVLGGPLIPILFGKVFSGSLWPYLILLPGAMITGGTASLSCYLLAKGKSHYSMYFGWTMLGVNVILNLLLIPHMGIRGAALASTLSYAVGLWMAARYFVRESGLRRRRLIPVAADVRYVLHTLRSFFPRKGVNP